MLVSGIMYSVAAYRISQTTKTATVSTFSTWGAFLIVVATFLITTFFVKPVAIPLALSIKPQQSPSYIEQEGASRQLEELQVSTGVIPQTIAGID